MRLFILLAFDFLVVFGSTVVSFLLSPSFTREVIIGGLFESSVLQVALGLAISVAVALYVLNSVDGYARIGRIEIVARAFVGCLFGVGLFAAVYALATNVLFGRYVLGFTFLLSWASTAGSRLLLASLRIEQPRKVYLIGTLDEGRQLGELIDGHLPGICVVGVSLGPPLVMGSTRLETAAGFRARGIADLIIAPGARLSEAEKDHLMACTLAGMSVVELNAFCERHLRCTFAPGLQEGWFWEYNPRYLHPIFSFFKRAFDILVSLTGLTVSLPFAVVIAAALRLQDRGPVFYYQVRTGYRGEPFRILKFRTMSVDAEKGGRSGRAVSTRG